ncbi:BON domain-containing protein [Agaribacterium haliotis]|uniref:BON domain-containing protein n=1 Tax=Agaribacterium haliotis TaxID=2013869 RepID=UPI001EFCBAFD|nr:BON domain-containing protein [Agaribacterium haliotis]
MQITDAVSDEPIQPDPTKRSFGEYWDDRNLHTIIRVNLNKADQRFDKLNVNVHVYNGVVLLTGEVPEQQLRDTAGKVAADVYRVRQVHNELTIGPKRSFGSHSKDSWLETKIDGKLITNGDIDSSRVEVYVENQVVYLMGMLSRAQTERITDVVRTTKGVKKVVRAIEYVD